MSRVQNYNVFFNNKLLKVFFLIIMTKILSKHHQRACSVFNWADNSWSCWKIFPLTGRVGGFFLTQLLGDLDFFKQLLGGFTIVYSEISCQVQYILYIQETQTVSWANRLLTQWTRYIRIYNNQPSGRKKSSTLRTGQIIVFVARGPTNHSLSTAPVPLIIRSANLKRKILRWTSYKGHLFGDRKLKSKFYNAFFRCLRPHFFFLMSPDEAYVITI